MTESASSRPLAAVALARDPLTVLGAPAMFLVPGLVALAAGPFLGAVGVGLAIAGGVAGGTGLWLLARILSLRLVVEADHLHLTGIATDRRFHLARGDLSRMASQGRGMGVRFGSMGWAVGPAELPSGERIEVIRLGATASLIVVPTEQGRVAVAARSERELLAALVAAARPAQRPPEPSMTAVAEPVARPLTGIERTLLEERLARERRAALYGAREERAAAGMASSIAALAPVGGPVPTAPAPAASFLTPSPVPVATIVAPAIAIPLPARRRRPSLPAAPRIARPALGRPTIGKAVALVAVPLVVTLGAWGLALVRGAAPGAEGLDPLAAALLLCGPIAALAIGLAHGRWPRLAALSSVSALIGLVLVVRALVG